MRLLKYIDTRVLQVPSVRDLAILDLFLKAILIKRIDSTYILGLPPIQDASHHQDYEPFLVGNPNLNLHLPLLLGGGQIQPIYFTWRMGPHLVSS